MCKSGHAKQQGGVSNDLSWDHPTTTFLWASRKCLSSFICQASEKGVCQSLAGPWTCQIHSSTIIICLFTQWAKNRKKVQLLLFILHRYFDNKSYFVDFFAWVKWAEKFHNSTSFDKKFSLECNFDQMR